MKISFLTYKYLGQAVLKILVDYTIITNYNLKVLIIYEEGRFLTPKQIPQYK